MQKNRNDVSLDNFVKVLLDTLKEIDEKYGAECKEQSRRTRVNDFLYSFLEIYEYTELTRDSFVRGKNNDSIRLMKNHWTEFLYKKLNVSNLEYNSVENTTEVKMLEADDEIYAFFTPLDEEEQLSVEVEKEIYETLRTKLNTGVDLLSEQASVSAVILLYLTHCLFGNLKCRKLYQQQLPYLNRKIDVDFNSLGNMVWVKGEPCSGKTRTLIEHLKSNKIIYFRQPSSYDSILDLLKIDEEKIFTEECQRAIGINEEIWGKRENRLSVLNEKYILIIEGYRLTSKDYEQIKQLSHLGVFQIFIEVRNSASIPSDAENVISINSFNKDEAVRLFFLVCENGKDEALVEELSINDLVSNICDQVYYNPTLIILLAQRFKNKTKKQGIECAFKDLSYIYAHHNDGKKDPIFDGDKFLSSLFPNQKTVELKICGHIKKYFEVNVPTLEKNAFYVLSLLNGIELDQYCIETWFDMKHKTIQNLVDDGWCYSDQNTMQIEIPEIIVYALKENGKDILSYRTYKRESSDKSDAFWTYINNFSKTLNRKDFNCADVQTIQQVILRIHDIFQDKLMQDSYAAKIICEFHFSCYKYFLLYGSAMDVSKLDMKFPYNEQLNGTGYSDYQAALDTLRYFMRKNNVIGLEELVKQLFDLYSKKNSTFFNLALIEFILLAYKINAFEAINTVIEIFSIESESNQSCLSSLKMSLSQNINVMSQLCDYLQRIDTKNKVISNFYKEYSSYFVEAINYSNSSLVETEEGILFFENSFPQLLGITISAELHSVAELENALAVNSYILILWSLYLIFPHINLQYDIIKKNMEKLTTNIQAIRSCLPNIPVVVCEIMTYALMLSAVALLTMKLFKIDTSSYNHVQLSSSEKTKEFKEIYKQFNDWVDSIQ